MSTRFKTYGSIVAGRPDALDRRVIAPLLGRHMRSLELPFRLTSTWMDRGCRLGTWSAAGRLLAWAVFLPPWHNLDYATVASERGSSLESEVVSWGAQQAEAYSERMGAPLSGSVEVLADSPDLERTADLLVASGFDRLDWDSLRFAVDPGQVRPPRHSRRGYLIRPTHGGQEERAYVRLVQAVFGISWMTEAWRNRITAHSAYRRDLDLVAVDPGGALAGFCLCWMQGDVAQIEPIGVHPDHQGRGLGSALEEVAADSVGQLGARRLRIDHGGTNDGAIAMSRKVGFREVGRIMRYGKASVTR